MLKNQAQLRGRVLTIFLYIILDLNITAKTRVPFERTEKVCPRNSINIFHLVYICKRFLLSKNTHKHVCIIQEWISQWWIRSLFELYREHLSRIQLLSSNRASCLLSLAHVLLSRSFLLFFVMHLLTDHNWSCGKPPTRQKLPGLYNSHSILAIYWQRNSMRAIRLSRSCGS
jgi:hypothetical protein